MLSFISVIGIIFVVFFIGVSIRVLLRVVKQLVKPTKAQTHVDDNPEAIQTRVGVDPKTKSYVRARRELFAAGWKEQTKGIFIEPGTKPDVIQHVQMRQTLLEADWCEEYPSFFTKSAKVSVEFLYANGRIEVRNIARSVLESDLYLILYDHEKRHVFRYVKQIGKFKELL